jgi:hypothetical protein
MPTNFAEAVKQLIAMSRDEPSIGVNRAVYLDRKRIKRVKSIGQMLGSCNKMQLAAEFVKSGINQEMLSDMRELDMAWNGIHGWIC